MSLDRSIVNLHIEFRGLVDRCENLKIKLNSTNFLISTLCNTYEEFRNKVDHELNIIDEKIDSIKHKTEDLQENMEDLQNEFIEKIETLENKINCLYNLIRGFTFIVVLFLCVEI